MSVQKLPSGRYRATVRDPATGKRVGVASILGPDYVSFGKKSDAQNAAALARVELARRRSSAVTVGEWADTWTSDPLYRRPKDSTNLHNAERVRGFVKQHRDLPLAEVSDLTVARWISGGKNLSTVPALRAMFGDAASAKAGRLIDRNPFAELGISPGTRRDQDPPSIQTVHNLIAAARAHAGPSFAAWLQVACFTGMRPGELDALTWQSVSFDGSRIFVREQYNAKTRTFTLPKNGKTRYAPLTEPARDALLALPREPGFCFTSLRGAHWTASSRAYHWKAVKAAVGYTGSLYLATRHFAGWWMWNALEMTDADVAIALGHEDGGMLVRTRYGHRDKELALDRAVAASRTGQVVQLRRKDVG